MKEFIDKLIARLEEMRTMELDMIGSYCQSTISKSISIVNELAESYHIHSEQEYMRGYSDAKAEEHKGGCCEWKKKNSNEYVCNTHAEIHDSRVLDWCICPYCGKKIKVVE